MKKLNRTMHVIILMAVSSMLMFSSCLKNWDFESDFKKISDSISASPEIALPVLNTTIRLSDYLPSVKDSSVYIDTTAADKLLHLKARIDITDFSGTKYLQGLSGFGSNLPALTYPVSENMVPLNLNSMVNYGEIYIKDPRIKLTIDCSIPIPLVFKMNSFNSYREKNILGVAFSSANLINVPIAVNTGRTVVNIDRTNSNIDLLLSSLPKFVSFAGSVSNVPQSGAYNIGATSSLKALLEIDIPFDIRLNNFVLTDTSAFSMTQEFSDYIESLYVKMPITNGFPLNLKLQAYFVNDAYTKIDSIFDKGPIQINSATVDASGNVSQAVESITEISMNKTRAKRLKDATKVIISARLSTANAQVSSTTSVKFSPRYYIKVKLGFKAIGKLRLNQF